MTTAARVATVWDSVVDGVIAATVLGTTAKVPSMAATSCSSTTSCGCSCSCSSAATTSSSSSSSASVLSASVLSASSLLDGSPRSSFETAVVGCSAGAGGGAAAALGAARLLLLVQRRRRNTARMLAIITTPTIVERSDEAFALLLPTMVGSVFMLSAFGLIGNRLVIDDAVIGNKSSQG